MSVITLQADSTTLILNDRSITNLGEGDYLTLTPVNAATAHVNSAGGGVTISERFDKDVHDLVVRVQKYSDDDAYFLGVINGENITVLNGSAKDSYIKDGTSGVQTYTLESGSITTLPTETKNNQDGNALMEYTIRFRTAKRSL